MTINQRVAHFVKIVSVSEILKKTDLRQSALYKIQNGGGVNGITLEKIAKGFPSLNTEWLISGIGKMWKSDTLVESELNESSIKYGGGSPVVKGVLESLQQKVNELDTRVTKLEKDKGGVLP